MSFTLCIISVFASIGMVFTIIHILDIISKHHAPNPCIVIGVKNHADSIEGIVRLIMKRHPYSEIMLIDFGSSDDTPKIIDKLCSDYTRVFKKSE